MKWSFQKCHYTSLYKLTTADMMTLCLKTGIPSRIRVCEQAQYLLVNHIISSNSTHFVKSDRHMVRGRNNLAQGYNLKNKISWEYNSGPSSHPHINKVSHINHTHGKPGRNSLAERLTPSRTKYRGSITNGPNPHPQVSV